MTLVLDASVLVKWLIPNLEREPDLEQALTIMTSVQAGTIQLLQPVHWLAEVAAVLARINPESVVEDVELLRAMELPVADSTEVYRQACRLAVILNHHVFDTLYHAVALVHTETILVSADRRYINKAGHLGSLMALDEWQP